MEQKYSAYDNEKIKEFNKYIINFSTGVYMEQHGSDGKAYSLKDINATLGSLKGAISVFQSLEKSTREKSENSFENER